MTLVQTEGQTQAEDAQAQDAQAFGELIAALVAHRKSLGLTQTDVADSMGVKQSAVSEIETSVANPTLRRLQRYARGCGAALKLEVIEVQD